jgi:hypothetical protein
MSAPKPSPAAPKPSPAARHIAAATKKQLDAEYVRRELDLH